MLAVLVKVPEMLESPSCAAKGQLKGERRLEPLGPGGASDDVRRLLGTAALQRCGSVEIASMKPLAYIRLATYTNRS